MMSNPDSPANAVLGPGYARMSSAVLSPELT
jgi:hypothetical protein